MFVEAALCVDHIGFRRADLAATLITKGASRHGDDEHAPARAVTALQITDRF